MKANRQALIRSVIWIGLGLAIGIGVGLFLGWVAFPLEYSEADPAVLEEDYQEDYALMIAAAYADDSNLLLARRRLSSFDKDDVNRWVLGITVDHILNKEGEEEILNLVKLSNDLGQYSPIMEPYLNQIESEGVP